MQLIPFPCDNKLGWTQAEAVSLELKAEKSVELRHFFLFLFFLWFSLTLLNGLIFWMVLGQKYLITNFLPFKTFFRESGVIRSKILLVNLGELYFLIFDHFCNFPPRNCMSSLFRKGGCGYEQDLIFTNFHFGQYGAFSNMNKFSRPFRQFGFLKILLS